MTEGQDIILTGGTAKLLHEVEGVHALHTGHAVGADLFLIGQDTDGGVSGVLVSISAISAG